MDTYHLLYRFREDPPDQIRQITGTIPDIYILLKGMIHKIDEFNLKGKDLHMVAFNRGDAIIIYDYLPMAFNPFIKEFRSFTGRKEPNMAVNHKKSAETENKQAEQAQALAIEVLRAKDFTEDGKDGCSISFDMKVNEVTIYGCWYREGKDKKGEDYQLVSFPSKQGKDGKYYSHAYVKLQQSDIDLISKQIESLL